MPDADQEVEAKCYISDLPSVEAHLRSLGASCITPRTHEYNLRFDTPRAELASGQRVLRLRKSDQNLLTYKGPGKAQDGIISRKEIEVSVTSFEKTREILEALGYQVIFIYEKFRATYALNPNLIMLDELPYGNFLEIEGDEDGIRTLARNLNLHLENATVQSYHALFQTARRSLDLAFDDLTFANFINLRISPSDLGLAPAD